MPLVLKVFCQKPTYWTKQSFDLNIVLHKMSDEKEVRGTPRMHSLVIMSAPNLGPIYLVDVETFHRINENTDEKKSGFR